MALPAATALRQAFPETAWTVLAAGTGGAVYTMAGVSDVRSANRRGWKQRPLVGVREVPMLIQSLRRQKFDLSVDLHSFKETNLLAWLAGIPERVAMLRPTRSWPGLINRKPAPDDPEGRLLDRYCQVVEALGVDVLDRVPRLDPPAAAVAWVRERFGEWGAGEAPILGLWPGAGHPGRRWPAEKFAELVRQFQSETAARVAVLTGPEEEEGLLAPFRGLPGTRVWPGFGIPELAAALQMCHVVVANPTGPAHVAGAVGARVVVLGEIPAFDPVARPPGAVEVLRAHESVANLTVAEVLGALKWLWTERAQE